MITIRLGTRGSRLALAQSRRVAERLEQATPGTRIELVEIRTAGDRIQDVPLGPHLGQSFFTKEIEDALLDERIDLAVHSCKDLATTLPEGLVIGAVPEREDPRDAVVSAAGPLAELPAGSRVGTSSMRRKGFLSVAYPHLALQEQRGNVPTRIAAVDEARADAVILAVAGLKRLGLDSRITEVLEAEVMLPAAAQGALALQHRAGDGVAAEVVAKLEHGPTRLEITSERACLRVLEAGCQAPVGALARASGESVKLDAAVVTPDGVVRTRKIAAARDAEEAGSAAAEDLLGQLGLSSLRDAVWAGTPPLRQGRTR